MCEELRHSIDYVENENKQDLKKIYVSGGGALALDTLDVLARETGKPVSFWDHTQKMKLVESVPASFMQAHSAELTVALGMTLRNLGGVRK